MKPISTSDYKYNDELQDKVWQNDFTINYMISTLRLAVLERLNYIFKVINEIYSWSNGIQTRIDKLEMTIDTQSETIRKLTETNS